MPTENIDTQTDRTLTDRVADVARRAVDFSHEAQRIKSRAEDAVEDGVYAARRALKSARRSMDTVAADAREDAVHFVKRQPLKSVAVAAGAGLLAGVVIGWVGARLATRRPQNPTPRA